MLAALATTSPIQLNERVSRVEAMSRDDHLNGQILYQEEAFSRNARRYPPYPRPQYPYPRPPGCPPHGPYLCD